MKDTTQTTKRSLEYKDGFTDGYRAGMTECRFKLSAWAGDLAFYHKQNEMKSGHWKLMKKMIDEFRLELRA